MGVMIQYLAQAFPSELFPGGIGGFDNPVGVQQEDVVGNDEAGEARIMRVADQAERRIILKAMDHGPYAAPGAFGQQR